jgi:hypothetical protein
MVVSAPCQNIVFQLFAVGDNGAITGDPIASTQTSVCPNGDYKTFGLPGAFTVRGYVSPTYAITWHLTSGGFLAGPMAAAAPAPGFAVPVAMLMNGVPAYSFTQLGLWQAVQVSTLLEQWLFKCCIHPTVNLQVTCNHAPLLDSSYFLRVAPDGSSAPSDANHVYGIAFSVPFRTDSSEL